MKIVSYNRSTGRRAKEKVHEVEDPIGVGYQRDGLTGKRLPGSALTFYFDGRVYFVELDEKETKSLFQRLEEVMPRKE